MLKPVKSILFATNLTNNCQPAFNFTISLATQFQAKIYLLYVIEKLPEAVDDRIKSLVGVHEWEDLLISHKEMAHKSLLGKTPSNILVKQAIYDFVVQGSSMNDLHESQPPRQIIVSYGDIAEDVINQARANNCDLIVLGSHKNLFSKTVVGGTTKSILKKSKIPVTIVPPETT